MPRVPAAVVAVVACALAACGTGANPLTAAVSKTSAASGARISLVSEISSPATGAIRFTGTGAMDIGGRRMHLRMRVPVPERAPTAVDSSKLEIEQIIEDGVIYMRVPFLADQLPEGKSWTRIDLAQAGKAVGLDVGHLMQGGGGDPAASVAWLKSAMHVKAIAQVEVRGVATTHYRATMSLGELAATLPEDQRDGYRKTVGQLRELGLADTFPMEAWISDDDLVRRMRYGWTQDIPGVGRTRMTFTIELFDYGRAVAIPRAPQADSYDVTPFTA